MFFFSRYAEGEPSVFPRVTSVLLKFFQEVSRRMKSIPMSSWAAQRYQDMILSIHWLLENAPQGQEQMLWDLAETAHRQGVDWEVKYLLARLCTRDNAPTIHHVF